MSRILHITPDFNYSCGRSKLVFLCLKYFGSKSGYDVQFITNGGDSLERLKEIGITYKIFNFSTGLKNIFLQKKFLNELKEYIKKNQIQLIHTHHRFPEYISVKAAAGLNVKTVTTALSFVKGYRRLSFKSDKIICVSNSISAYLQENFYVDKKKIITLYNPDDDPSIQNGGKLQSLIKELGINPGGKIILFMGRINLDKGYDTVLKSFGLVKKEFKNSFLLLCGSIEDRRFDKILDRHDNSIKVIQPRPGMNLFYGIADLIVLPSRVEPFPFVMVESGRFKKPFIGGNTGGIAEFIEDGKNGLLVQPGNSDELAEKIIYLLKNEDYAKSLGENLYIKVKEKCDYGDYFKKVEEIYNSLLTKQ